MTADKRPRRGASKQQRPAASSSSSSAAGLLEPVLVDIRSLDFDTLLSREWLLSNRLGAYASGTVLGSATRRYHGLLIASLAPPVRRVVALSTIMESLTIGETTYDLATNEFDSSVDPLGYEHLERFENGVPMVFVYRLGSAELRKEIILADSENAVAVRYRLSGASGRLVLRPFTALRDFHHLRDSATGELTTDESQSVVTVRDPAWPEVSVSLLSDRGQWQADAQWWRRFRYRVDNARGQDCHEDLFTPGTFTCELSGSHACQLTACLGQAVSVDFDHEVSRRRERLAQVSAAVGADADVVTRRLAVATDAFLVDRATPEDRKLPTILAGFHWFADWGRDAFISLPGLLLTTGRFEQAREVFQTFARHMSDGMIPNRFDDYATTAHYNSIDASLWFILAAERYLQASGDEDFWRDHLAGPVLEIVRAYRDGTQFGIHADGDGLLSGGSATTQLTWMDAKLANEAVTPRHGKAVEINALWYNAHRILASRCQADDPALARQFADQADRIAASFVETFWNEPVGHLNDCITAGVPDATLRPNQIFAVSLPHSPLPMDIQRRVVRRVGELLGTPMGLRTLSPFDPRYRRRYGGSWESRDRSYHQGTVWAWLVGPYVEARLKVAEDLTGEVEDLDRYLANFDEHLAHAGMGFISEIFDADPPHYPRGCIAQAWSVAEVLRAKMLVAAARRGLTQE